MKFRKAMALLLTGAMVFTQDAAATGVQVKVAAPTKQKVIQGT